MAARVALADIGGLTVEICSSGEEALEKVAEFSPDLILLDINMPDMDGPAVFKSLRGRRESSSIPVIFLTAQIEERDSCIAMGALDVIAKPFDPMTLSETVQSIWNGRSGA